MRLGVSFGDREESYAKVIYASNILGNVDNDGSECALARCYDGVVYSDLVFVVDSVKAEIYTL